MGGVVTGAVTIGDVRAAMRDAGLADRAVCVHASLKSFGRVDGSAEAVVQGMLDVGTTVVVPTSTFRFCMAPKPAGLHELPFNSEDDGSIPPPGTSAVAGYDRTASFVDPAMGAIPAAVLRYPKRIRGIHPLSSFTALGPDAGDVIAAQTPTHVYAPLQEIVARRGAVVCMGVGLDALTLIHLAEVRAGLRLLHRWALTRGGTVVEAVHGGCSRGFERLADVAKEAETRIVVGDSVWRIFDAAALLAVTTKQFVEDPEAGVCANPGCVRCRDQVAYASRFRREQARLTGRVID
jgi:aminoglycoside 3-N-acetyltransferase